MNERFACPARDVVEEEDAAMLRECPDERCGHVNPHVARFCARCGRPLRPSDVHKYSDDGNSGASVVGLLFKIVVFITIIYLLARFMMG